MGNWQTTVKCSDLFTQFHAGKLTLADLARELAARLRCNRYAEMLGEELEALDALAETPTTAQTHAAAVEKFDAIMDELYNLGDEAHRIWFDTLG